MADRQYVDSILEQVKARVRINDLVTGLVWLLAVVLVALLAIIAVDQARPLAYPTRLWLLGGLGGAVLLGLAALLAWPSLRRINDVFAARLVERCAEERFRNSLVAYVELRSAGSTPPDVLEAVAARAAADLETVDVDTVVDRRLQKWAGIVCAAVVVLGVVLALSSPKRFSVSVARAIGMAAAPPTATRILDIRPESGSVVSEGADVTVEADVGGELPADARLRLTRDGEHWDDVPMSAPQSDRHHWRAEVGNVLDDVRFTVLAGDARSGEHVLRVRPLPRVTDVTARLTWPAYTLRPPDTSGGNVEALVGTTVEVRARTNQPAERPRLVFGDGDRAIDMHAAGDAELRGRFEVTRDTRYHIRFVGETGEANDAAIRYRVRALEDRPPTVELSAGDAEVRVPAGGRIDLAVRAADDFGIDRIELAWRTEQPGGGLADERRMTLRQVDHGQARLRVSDAFAVAVESLDLAAGDAGRVWIVAADRYPGEGGPHMGRSDEVRVVVTEPDEDGSGGREGTETAGGESDRPDPQAGDSGSAGADTRTASLTDQQRDALEQLREATEPGGGRRDESEQQQEDSGAGRQPSGEEPGGEQRTDGGRDEPGDDAGGGESSGEQGEEADAGGQPEQGRGPAREGTPPGQRAPDVEPGERLEEFSETGRAPEIDTATAEQLRTLGPTIRTLGPTIRTLRDQLRRGEVDPELLQSLGWSEAELGRVVEAYTDRFGEFAAEGPGGEGADVGTARSGETVGSGDGASARTGGGTTDAEIDADDLVENIESQSRRVAPRYRRLVEEYLKAISEAETGSD